MAPTQRETGRRYRHNRRSRIWRQQLRLPHRSLLQNYACSANGRCKPLQSFSRLLPRTPVSNSDRSVTLFDDADSDVMTSVE